MTDTPSCIEAAALRALLAGRAEVLVLDVRSPAEYADGHIEGAMNLPLDDLPAALARLPAGREIVTVCGKGGGRSDKAAGLLIDHGFRAVRSLCGGMAAWSGTAP
jgi:rhodanese-related sulfurtransferase